MKCSLFALSIRVETKHPNVRLALTNSLMSHRDCIIAFAEIARECGLSCPEDLSSVRTAVEAGACGSLTTARLVLEATVKKPEMVQELWERLLGAVEEYKLQARQKHCRGIDLEPTAIDCSGMAPVVMDMLLQIIESHARK